MTNHPDDRHAIAIERALRADARDTRYPPTPDVAGAVATRLRQRSPAQPRHARQIALLFVASLCFVVVGGLLVFLFRDSDDPEEHATPQIAASPEATTAVASPAATTTATVSPVVETAEQLLVVSSGYRSPEDGHEQLLLVDPADGTVGHLTNQPGEHKSPSLSPDGTQVVFIGDRNGTIELYVLTIADGTVRRLTDNNELEDSPAWSPAGDRIAFDCYPKDASGQSDSRICLIDPDGSDLIVIVEDDLRGYRPVWSPDGSQLVVTGAGGATDGTYVVDANGSNVREILPEGLGGKFEAWSPDGTQFAYSSWRTDDTSAIYIMNADGTNDHPLVDPPQGMWATWSPDGTQLAIVNWFGGERYGLAVVNADGTGPRQLADDLGYTIAPIWSPDGDEVAIVNDTTLEVFAADGSARRTLMTGLAPASPVHWQTTTLPPAPASPTPTATGRPTAALPTLEEIYAGLQETLSQPDQIAHVSITTTGPEESMNQNGAMEFWIDGTHDRARVELRGDVVVMGMEVTFETTSVLVQGISYTLYRQPESRIDTVRSQRCYDIVASVTTLLDCPGGPTENSTTTVEWGDWQGQPALMLVTIGTSRGSDEQFTFTDRTFLDPETFLPLGQRVEGTHSYGKVDTTSVYEHEFIDAAAIPADHFDPVALAIERLDTTTQGTPLYWLGARAEPAVDLPPLVLMDGGVPATPDEGYDASLTYRMEEPRIALSNTIQSEVVLFMWPRAEWDQRLGDVLQRFWADDECGQAIEIEVENGQATLFLGFLGTSVPSQRWVDGTIPPPQPATDCVDGPYQRFEAVVTFEETVVFLYLPPESAYCTPEALEAIVRAIQRR